MLFVGKFDQQHYLCSLALATAASILVCCDAVGVNCFH